MSKTKKLRPADRHITRAECQALFVAMMNQMFGQMAQTPAPPAPDGPETVPTGSEGPE